MMTSDLTHRYTAKPGPGYTAYDLPADQYRLTIGKVNAAHARVSLTDPLTGQDERAPSSPGRNAGRVQLPVTDSPRMLTMSMGRVLLTRAGDRRPRRAFLG